MQLSEERLQRLLVNVQKPLRYVGREWNSIVKDWAGVSVRLALAYPDATTGFLGAVAKFLGVFAVTQIPLSIAEGVLGVLLFGFFTRVTARTTSSAFNGPCSR